MQELISRVTVMAIGVDQYEDPSFRNLYGPLSDLDNLHNLLVGSKHTALFGDNQFISLFNPSAHDLRNQINNYVLERSADKDIILFYFSGHGVPVGRNDFGFCTTDTKIFPNRGPLPMSVVKYSELLRSLEIANVIPIVIIDACYSGLAGTPHYIESIDAISTMRDHIHSRFASEFALLCACSDEQFTEDTPYGGKFSQYLFSIAQDGLSGDDASTPLLSLQSIFNNLNRKVLSEVFEERPRLFIGPTLPEFPFVKNTKFALRSYTLSPTLVDVVKVLWNDGEERKLSPHELGELLTKGAYCNHNKLSFLPWDLVETIPGTRIRRISPRGRDFMQGILSVPHKIIEDPVSGSHIRANNTHNVSIGDYQ